MYVEVGVPEQESQYTALSSVTADKKDGSEYTSLIKTPTQTPPIGLPIIQTPEQECTYKYKDVDLGVPEYDHLFPALSSSTASKEEDSQCNSPMDST